MAEQYHAKDLRAGNVYVRNGGLFLVLDNSFNKTAMREGIVKCKVKNMRTGAITVEVLTGEKLEAARVDRIQLSYSYNDGSSFVFMNNETFETTEIPNERMQWEKNFLVEGAMINVLFYDTEVLGVELPDQMALPVAFAEEGVRGNTVSAAQKKARLVTGWEIEVPQFIKTGETVLINTSDGRYVSRA